MSPRLPPREGRFEGRFPPPMLLRLPPPIFELRLKLLLLLMLMSLLPPQPQPQPQPPLQKAPIITPTPKEIAIPAACNLGGDSRWEGTDRQAGRRRPLDRRKAHTLLA